MSEKSSMIVFQLDYKYTIVEQADLIATALQTFKATDIHILSHDYGDSIAQELLARWAAR